jgi:hypothetical protein
MTINGGKPHAVGDRGQRYEITYFDGRAAERRTLGWCETREQADMVVLTMSSHPVWSGFQITDRHETPNQQVGSVGCVGRI